MPSPFPGIDPYLEAQGRWTDFHPRLIALACDELAESLPDDYVAQIGERLDLVTPAEGWPVGSYPDVAVVGPPTGSDDEGGISAAGITGWNPVTIPYVIELEEARHTWIEILHLPEQRLVTAIEVLSPSNKSGGGAAEYRAKRDRMMASGANFVEIDLLIAGRRITLRQPPPKGDYLVLVSRADRRPNCEVSTWSIRQMPPTIPIPLAPGDPDVLLDLAKIVTLAYERGRYHRLIDYLRPLGLPLGPDDRQWAEERARTAPG